MRQATFRHTVALGQALAEARHERGLSQEAAALGADSNRNTLGNIERAENGTSFAMLVRLTASIGIRMSDLVARYERRYEALVEPGAWELELAEFSARAAAAEAAIAMRRRGRGRPRRKRAGVEPRIDLARLGLALRAAREERGLTRRELAQLARCPMRTILLVESGMEVPSLLVLDEIARVLRRSVAGLLGAANRL